MSYEMVEEVIGNYEKDQILIDQIERRVNNKNSLEQFSAIQLQLPSKCDTNCDSVFTQFMRSKMKAQVMLNLYYNYDYYQECSILTIFNEENSIHQSDMFNNERPNLAEVTSTLLRYIVLLKILSTLEAKKLVKTCTFCYNDIDIDNVHCSVCLATVSLDMCRRTVKDPVPSYWECSSCTFRNNLSNKQCETCLEQRTETKNDIENTDITEIVDTLRDENQINFIICSSCTYKNSVGNTSCDICLKSLIENPSHDVIVTTSEDCNDQKWKCGKCQQEYLFDKYMCLQCQKYAPFVQSWKCENCNVDNDKTKAHCCKCNNVNQHLIPCKRCRINVIFKEIDNLCSECSLAIEYWKCTYCDELNTDTNCTKCKNMRHGNNYKLCSCKWSNLPGKMFCGNCHTLLSPPEIFKGLMNEISKFTL